MADNFPGEITIGGKVPANLLEEFLGELDSTGAKVGGYDGAEFDAKTAHDLRQALDENGHLFLADAEARYGQFEELEAFCVQHGISFDRHSDARYEFDAENVYFRPGMKGPLVVRSDNDGDDLLDISLVRPIARELVGVVAAAATNRKKLLAAVTKTIRALNKLLQPEVEPLPQLQIIGE